MPNNQYFLYKYVYDDRVIYIGQTIQNPYSRIIQHKYEEKFKPYSSAKVFVCKAKSKQDMNTLETLLIGKYRPELNVSKNFEDSYISFIEPEWEPIDKYLPLKSKNPAKRKTQITKIRNKITALKEGQRKCEFFATQKLEILDPEFVDDKRTVFHLRWRGQETSSYAEETAKAYFEFANRLIQSMLYEDWGIFNAGRISRDSGYLIMYFGVTKRSGVLDKVLDIIKSGKYISTQKECCSSLIRKFTSEAQVLQEELDSLLLIGSEDL